MPLHIEAVLAYERLLLERFQEKSRYEQMALTDAVREKLEKMFGGGRVVKFEDGATEHVVRVVVEGFHFIGVRHPKGDIKVCWVVSCPGCGEQVASKFLTSIIDIGREINALTKTGKIGEHECPKPTIAPSSK